METTTSRLEASGTLLIPAEWRRRLNLKPGQDIVLGLEDNQIRILGSREQVIREVQNELRKYGDPNRLWSEELSSERREEVDRER